jgi:serine O-acetyltransferase
MTFHSLVVLRFRQDVERWMMLTGESEASRRTFWKTVRLLVRYLPLRAVLWFRIGTWFQNRGYPLIPGLIQRHIFRAYGLEIRVGTDVGGGLFLPHLVGTVIVARCIGENCTVQSNVTFGMRNDGRFPTIGDNVLVGAGARILGGITIGDNAVIEANAVVINDVPAGATVAGIPARVII